MNRMLLLACVIGAAIGVASQAAVAQRDPATDARAAFALVKTLEGTWTAKADGRQSRTSLDNFVTEWEFFEKGVKTLTEVEAFTRVR